MQKASCCTVVAARVMLLGAASAAARAPRSSLAAATSRAERLPAGKVRAILALDVVAHFGLQEQLKTPRQRAAHRRSRKGKSQLRQLKRERLRLLRKRLMLSPPFTLGTYDAKRRGVPLVVGRDAAQLIAADSKEAEGGKDRAPELPGHCFAHDRDGAAAFCFPQLPIREQDVPFSVDSGDGGGWSRVLLLPATRRQAAAIDRKKARVTVLFSPRKVGRGKTRAGALHQVIGGGVEVLVADGDRVLLRRRFR